MGKRVLLFLGAILLVLIVYAAISPSDFRVARQIEIALPAEAIFPHFNSPRLANQWNPFVEQDPNTKLTYNGPETGIGASSTWQGAKAGEGTATIIESVPSKLVRVRLEFRKPFTGTNLVDYYLEPTASGTRVEWAMTGQANFFQRFICIFMSMDKMVGAEFERGLQNLNKLITSNPS